MYDKPTALLEVARSVLKPETIADVRSGGYPPYTTVSSFYHRAIESGFWNAFLAKLVEKSRINAGSNPDPSYAVIDSQSAKTVGASEERRYDGGKKIKGHKRHIMVDMLGQLLSVIVHAANHHDTRYGYFPALEAITKYPGILAICGDAGYRGTFVEDVEDFLGRYVDMVEKAMRSKFEILPKR